MPTSPLASFQAYFGGIDDPRIERSKRRQPLDIIVIPVCAAICGADSWGEVAACGEIKLDWLRQYLAFPNGTRCASHDAFSSVFGRLKAEQLDPHPYRAAARHGSECGGPLPH